MKIKSIRKTKTPKTVYDITVDRSSRYVLENGVLTHNSGLLYSSSSVIFLYKSKDKVGTEQVGVIIRAKMAKSRLTIENSEVRTQLNFKTGLNRYYGLVPLAEAAGVCKKEGTRYLWADGKKYFESQINKEPEKFYTQEILEKIDAYAKTAFTYQGGENDSEVILSGANDEED